MLVDGNPYDLREMRIKDLPIGHRPLEVVWRKRRYRCGERACMQRVFTERSRQIPPRRRLTLRLRQRLEEAASRSVQALSDVADEYGVSWWTVSRALLDKVLSVPAGPLPPVRMLGLDETRARSMRWQFDDGHPGRRCTGTSRRGTHERTSRLSDGWIRASSTTRATNGTDDWTAAAVLPLHDLRSGGGLLD